MTRARESIRVTVELFGTPRIRCGRTEVELAVPCQATRSRVIAALADECPGLVGHGIRADMADLEEGFVLNLNGLAFLGEGDFNLSDGDALLLISSQAGG